MSVNKEKMNEIFGNLNKKNPVAILQHKYPDPDSLGSAAGFAILLKEVYGLNSKIFYEGGISHPQNKTLKNILHIQLEDAKNFNSNKSSAIVILDSDLTNTGLKDRIDSVNVIIDHHSNDRDTIMPVLLDIRLIGSTSTIIYEYLKAFDIKLEEHMDVIISLIFGIKTDTLDFTSENTTTEDIDAFRLLLPMADKTLMSKINKYPLSEAYFDIQSRAVKDKEQKGTALVSYIGDVGINHRDTIATMADLLIRLDSVETAMVLGLVENSLVISLRNDDTRIELNEVIAKIFGKDKGGSKGGYSGGATFDLGPIAMISDKKVREAAINEIVNSFKKKLFEVLGEKMEEETEDKK